MDGFVVIINISYCLHDLQHALFELQGHRDNITGLAFSRDGTHLASACEDQSVRLFAVADVAGKGNALRTRAFNLIPSGVAIGRSSSQLLTVLQSK